MALMHSEYTARIQHWTRTLKQDLYRPLQTISFEGFTTMEHLTPGEAAKGNFSPIPEGYAWGHTWEYMWLRADVTLPQEARGKKIVMDLNLSGEATLFVNGLTFGTRRAEWVKTPHHYMVDNILAEQAEGGERFHLLFEVYAGHFFPDVGGCATGPVLPGSFADPLEEGKRATVGHSSVGEWCEDAYQLMMDVETLDQLMHCMDATSLRAAKIAEGLEAYTRTVDFEQDAAGRDANYRAARELLHPLMQASNGSTAPRFCAVGNAHLDLAWLWPMAETHRKTARTFAQQLRLLERYPEYKFIQSQPASYEMCREHYPELYERIRAAIKRGQWIADGAMYVEPDTNMASGEALIRQLVHGKRFYRDELGVDSKVLWLPDTFGYTAALPQILRGCGVNYLVTQKIFWSYNEGDQFPYHYFTWKGMDGSAVTSFLPTSYTYDTKPEELYGVWKNRVQTRDLDAFFVPFGYGDGGGGPTRDHVEYALRERDLEGMPKLEMMGPQQFFEEMEKEGAPKNTWDGELYFSAHRGTYTSQAKVKKNNRLSELALREAELWGALAEKRGHAYPLAEMDRLWKVLLLHQFHDILPGSSIARVYVEANQAHAKLQAEAVEIAQAAREQLVSGDGLTVFNSLSFPRKALVKLPASFGSGAKTLEGETVPVLDGVAIVELPPMGVVALLPGEAALEAPRAVATLTATGAVLENELVKAVLNELGEVVSFVRKETGREFVAQPMNRMLLYKDVPRLFDAWDIDSNYIEQPVELARKAELSVVCAGGAKAVLKLRRELDGSVLEQEITLSAIGERLDFVTNVDWHELHRLLKVSFTGTPRSNEAIHEMQFGYVKRPTHRSRAYDKDRFEVCNHRYTALCDESHGFAVLNNCKYGVSVNGSSIELTLLRAAASPEMRADQGTHTFTYALYAWDGAFAQSGVVREGYDLNVPAITAPGHAERFSAMAVDKANIFIDTVKPAEDGSGDLIVRLYESLNMDLPFHLQVNLPFAKASLCDMLENEQEALEIGKDGIALHAAPFQILTVRLHG